jgi:hypothetical protein
MNKALEYFIVFIKEEIKSNNLLKRIKLFEAFLKTQFNYEIIDEDTKIINKYINNNDIKDLDYDDDEMPVILDEKDLEMVNFDENDNRMIIDNTVESSQGNMSDIN